jgi:hypothetical protein
MIQKYNLITFLLWVLYVSELMGDKEGIRKCRKKERKGSGANQIYRLQNGVHF